MNRRPTIKEAATLAAGVALSLGSWALIIATVAAR